MKLARRQSFIIRCIANLKVGCVMPWLAQTAFEARSEFVRLASAPAANIRGLCRRFGISATVGYRTLEQFRLHGEAGLRDHSRRPKLTPTRTPANVEAAVLAVRAEHPLWGARKIAACLRQRGAKQVPAPSTIGGILCRNGLLMPRNEPAASVFLSSLMQSSLNARNVSEEFPGTPDLDALLERTRGGSLWDRRRAIVVLANRHGIRVSVISRHLKISVNSCRRTLKVFSEGGATALFARRQNPHRKVDNEAVKKTVFGILHQPPGNFGINRTTWTMAGLARIATQQGQPICEETIRIIVKAAGYRWRRARVVLTSNDPEFTAKVAHIRRILSTLAPDEAFFSIDEYGPFAVKAQPGRSLVAPGEQRFVPQFQRSRGFLIITAAIELSTNQVTHFYSARKNTAEMIRMMEILAQQYADRRRIILSWDAASWHVSKELFKRVDEHNAAVGATGPIVENAPLPARAQFLNVIESVFSGMARAIIHNSNYPSVDDAKAAIDRYFSERNAHFRQHPRRAGGKLWGKEPEPADFSESSNCKDPRLR